jgi:hypothetical protein
MPVDAGSIQQLETREQRVDLPGRMPGECSPQPLLTVVQVTQRNDNGQVVRGVTFNVDGQRRLVQASSGKPSSRCRRATTIGLALGKNLIRSFPLRMRNHAGCKPVSIVAASSSRLKSGPHLLAGGGCVYAVLNGRRHTYPGINLLVCGNGMRSDARPIGTTAPVEELWRPSRQFC